MSQQQPATTRGPSIVAAFLGQGELTRRQALVIDLLTDFLAPLILSGVALHELLYNLPQWWVWVLVTFIVWPLAWRRRAPVIVFFVILAAVLALSALGQDSFSEASLLVALYSIAAHRPFRVALASAIILEGGVLLVSFRFAPAGSVDDAVTLLSGTTAAVLFLGTTLRARRSYLASVEGRAARLERERAQQAEIAALEERSRIAREMHDIVAHGLSVVITLSEGAAAIAETDPARAKAAMQAVAAGGRESLGEMRGLLGVLRSEGAADRSPHPGLDRLPELVTDVRRTGLDVELRESGDATFLSQAVQASLYRVVQEALTNVIKHSPAAVRVDVELLYRDDIVRFSIQDDGGVPVGVAASAGNGLTGIRERVAIFDGSVEAGPADDGWRVAGELKLR